jgi:cell pole-organizing protein PopZ
MSTSQSPTPPQPQPSQAAADPSMEDILASIRRILSEDETDHAATAVPSGQPASSEEDREHDDVLDLDAAMIVEEPPSTSVPEPPTAAPASPPAPAAPPPPVMSAAEEGLVAPEAVAAAASSVSELLRSVVAGREQVAVHRGGPTIEDLVREEIRPLLKQWLDVNLPPLVERLVRAEMERVVGRIS